MTDSDGENARAYLDSLRRGDLSALLLHARVETGVHLADFGSGGQWVVVVRAPQPFAEALSALPDMDRKRIAEAAVSRKTGSDYREPLDIVVKQAGDPMEGSATLLPDLIIHKAMMTAIATGKTNIPEVDDYYVARQFRLVEGCAAAAIKYENPHESLWDFFRYWKAEGMDQYRPRREYLQKLFAEPIAAAVGRVHNPSPVAEREATGWELVDRQLAKARLQFDRASAEEDWQGVGLTCREALISLGQSVYVKGLHESADGVKPSSTDAKRMLEAYIRHELPGDGYKEVRAHARASVDLAVHLQHRRTATRRLAALCLEATSSAASVVAIIAGRAA